jgi:hypothetical protein
VLDSYEQQIKRQRNSNVFWHRNPLLLNCGSIT